MNLQPFTWAAKAGNNLILHCQESSLLFMRTLRDLAAHPLAAVDALLTANEYANVIAPLQLFWIKELIKVCWPLLRPWNAFSLQAAPQRPEWKLFVVAILDVPACSLPMESKHVFGLVADFSLALHYSLVSCGYILLYDHVAMQGNLPSFDEVRWRGWWRVFTHSTRGTSLLFLLPKLTRCAGRCCASQLQHKQETLRSWCQENKKSSDLCDLCASKRPVYWQIMRIGLSLQHEKSRIWNWSVRLLSVHYSLHYRYVWTSRWFGLGKLWKSNKLKSTY